jgi:arylsulfatase A-like enzyme
MPRLLPTRLLTAAAAATSLAMACTDPGRARLEVPGPVPKAVGRAPNVLIVVTDDQRAGLRVMPETRRYFVDGGTRFPNSFVATPLCCPSRATIFTGRYAHNHGVRSNLAEEAEHLDQRTTLQHYLHDAGYRTGIFGKYLNKWDLDRSPPGFDEWSINAIGSSYYNEDYNTAGEVAPVDEYSTDYLAEQARRFLRATERSQDARPWFLYVATTAPHGPGTPAPRYAGAPVPFWPGDPAARERDRRDKPGYVRADHFTLTEGRRLRRRQYRTLMSVDDLVGSVFETLRGLDENRRTLAFFVSDNGLMWGEHGLNSKGFPYTEAIRVPLLMRWPDHARAGELDLRLVSTVDLAPTVMDAARLEPAASAPMDGRSLLDHTWTRRRAFMEFWRSPPKFHAPTWASIRTKAYQFVQYYTGRGRPAFREYYDLASDPWQLHNLLRDHATSNDPDVARLERRVTADRRCAGRTCP